ncbi:MAG: LPS export ABC transporter periplasmic protein LptC, partial [Bdellovibrionota bacterium]
MSGSSAKRLYSFFFRRRLRPVLLLAISALILIEIIALSPSSVDEHGPTSPPPIEPELLMKDDEVTLAPGIPTDRIPEYSVNSFNYVSVQGGEKQWKLVAEKAFMYNGDKLVHSRHVTAYLYDSEDKTTVVTGLEAKYFMNKKDLEIFGDVKTVFPDGFEIRSEYLRYLPDQKMSFISQGMDSAMSDSVVVLPKAVRMTMERLKPKDSDSEGVPDRTIIESDHCLIHRDKRVAHFTMYGWRPLKAKFVHITQPTLYARGRRADMNYGEFSSVLQYLTAYEDVLIKETPKQEDNTKKGDLERSQDQTNLGKREENKAAILKYGTGSRADFDTHRDVVVLTGFPQVYQGDDTVTGDVITVHRDSDIVEVD